MSQDSKNNKVDNTVENQTNDIVEENTKLDIIENNKMDKVNNKVNNKIDNNKIDNNKVDNDKVDVEFYENQLFKLIDKSPIKHLNLLTKLGVILDTGSTSNGSIIATKDELIKFLSKRNIEIVESANYYLTLDLKNNQKIHQINQGLFNIGVYEISKKWFSSDYNIETFNLRNIRIRDIFKDQNLLKLIKKLFNTYNPNSKCDICEKIEIIPFIEI